MGGNCYKDRQVKKFLQSWTAPIFMALVMAFILFGADKLGRFEGSRLPAVSDVIVNVNEGPTDYQSILDGTFNRVRVGCEFSRIEWRLAKPGGGSVALDFEFLEPSQVRSAGPNDFGPWLIHADALQIANSVYADVYHDCHIGWLTVTRFYPQ